MMLLNTQLASASKKFYKSCEQIKVIKQHISELISVFSYCDQEINRLSQEHVSNLSQTVSTSTMSSTAVDETRSVTTITPTSTLFSSQDHTYSIISSSSPSSFNRTISSEYEVEDMSSLLSSSFLLYSGDNEMLVSDETTSGFISKKKHLSVFRESIRQQIENLQCVKTAYFMYAHRKADEITKLQCELYGEDIVREAYERGQEYYPPQTNQTIENNQDNQDTIINQNIQAENEANGPNWSTNNQVFEYLTA